MKLNKENSLWAFLAGLLAFLIYLGFTSAPTTAGEDEFCYEYSSDGMLCFPGFRDYLITDDGEEDVRTSVVKVTWYADYEEVTTAWVENTSQPKPHETIEAWSWSDWSDELGLWVCEIHAVKPVMIIGDARMDALGHELYHCFVGGFYDGE